MTLARWLDLVVPNECVGCRVLGGPWCARCLVSWGDVPIAVVPRVDAGVPCWALGAYNGVRREAILAGKLAYRTDHAPLVGAALASGIAQLVQWNEIAPTPLVLVPAPTRRSSARMRGGDPVERYARHAAASLPGARVVGCLRVRRGTRDSVGLGAQARAAHLRNRVVATRAREVSNRANVIVIDDVLTTGTTASESVAAVQRLGGRVSAVLVIAAVSRR